MKNKKQKRLERKSKREKKKEEKRRKKHERKQARKKAKETEKKLKIEKKEAKKKEKEIKKVGKIKKKLEEKRIKQKKKETIILQEPEKPTEKKAKSKKINKYITISFSISLILSLLSYPFTDNIKYSGIVFLAIFILIGAYFLIKEILKKTERVKKMELVFPDFIELMASNLRAGMTIDKALLLSSRKEFSPLDEEILILGKEIVTGKEITQSLLNMAERIKSEKILRTITIINSGIRSGGNLAVLLEQTAINMRTRGFTEKKASSNVLMYVIFIFFAVSIGAPILFSLSAVLIQVLTNILSTLPSIETSKVNIPFSLTSVNISVNFVKYFSILFLIIVDILASLLIGLVNKGEEKAGLKFMILLIILSMAVFFIVRFALLSYFSGVTLSP